MQKTIRFFVVVLFVVLCMGISSVAEEITLTTYYPAPLGTYAELVVDRDLTNNSATITGLSIDIDESGTNTGTVTGLGVDVSGVATGTRYAATFQGGTVGIGTATPAYLLDVAGEARFDGALYATDATGIGLRDDAGTLGLWVEDGGQVGIGMTAPTATLHVSGNIKAILNNVSGSAMDYNPGTDEIGFDVAELFKTTEEVEVGDLLVIDETKDLKLRKSQTPYEKGVIGIVSGSPAILFEGSQLEIAPAPNGFTRGNRPPVALAGRIQCKVSIENGPIERGDLLTSSSIPGHAMKATDRDRSFGAIAGKALESFNGGPEGEKTGKIIILVTLQ